MYGEIIKYGGIGDEFFFYEVQGYKYQGGDDCVCIVLVGYCYGEGVKKLEYIVVVSLVVIQFFKKQQVVLEESGEEVVVDEEKFFKEFIEVDVGGEELIQQWSVMVCYFQIRGVFFCDEVCGVCEYLVVDVCILYEQGLVLENFIENQGDLGKEGYFKYFEGGYLQVQELFFLMFGWYYDLFV